jgi:hypothetical protein
MYALRADVVYVEACLTAKCRRHGPTVISALPRVRALRATCGTQELSGRSPQSSIKCVSPGLMQVSTVDKLAWRCVIRCRRLWCLRLDSPATQNVGLVDCMVGSNGLSAPNQMNFLRYFLQCGDERSRPGRYRCIGRSTTTATVGSPSWITSVGAVVRPQPLHGAGSIRKSAQLGWIQAVLVHVQLGHSQSRWYLIVVRRRILKRYQGC